MKRSVGAADGEAVGPAAGRPSSDGGATTLTQYPTSHESVVATIEFENSSMVPDRAFSLGVGSGISAYHFLATSTAKSEMVQGSTGDRDATAVHTQAFYIVGPESPTL